MASDEGFKGFDEVIDAMPRLLADVAGVLEFEAFREGLRGLLKA